VIKRETAGSFGNDEINDPRCRLTGHGRSRPPQMDSRRSADRMLKLIAFGQLNKLQTELVRKGGSPRCQA